MFSRNTDTLASEFLDLWQMSLRYYTFIVMYIKRADIFKHALLCYLYPNGYTLIKKALFCFYVCFAF